MSGTVYLKDGFREIYFFKFHQKMRFPIFPTVRIYSPYWHTNVLKDWYVKLGSWKRPQEAELLGTGCLLASDKYRFGSLPRFFLEFDTGLKYVDAEELFIQMYKTQWEGDSTEVSLNIFLWNNRYKGFYDQLRAWNDEEKAKRKQRKLDVYNDKIRKKRRRKQHEK